MADQNNVLNHRIYKHISPIDQALTPLNFLLGGAQGQLRVLARKRQAGVSSASLGDSRLTGPCLSV